MLEDPPIWLILGAEQNEIVNPTHEQCKYVQIHWQFEFTIAGKFLLILLINVCSIIKTKLPIQWSTHMYHPQAKQYVSSVPESGVNEDLHEHRD